MAQENNKKNRDITTIKLEKQTKERLDKLKEHERESYNQTIKKILHIINIFRKSPESGNRLLSKIDSIIKKRSQVYQSIPKEDKTYSRRPQNNLRPKTESRTG